MTVKIGIIGAGAFGSALAQALVLEHDVRLYAREPEIVAALSKGEGHPYTHAGIVFDRKICMTNDLGDLQDREIIFLVVPAQEVKNIARQILEAGLTSPIVIAAKGVDVTRREILSDVLSSYIPNVLGVLSGPCFASELVQRTPTVQSLAIQGQAQAWCAKLSTDLCTFEPSDDLIGLQLAGSLKNVYAVGAGLLCGGMSGTNLLSAYLSRIAREMQKIMVLLGGQEASILSQAALGDLILTCSSTSSRNYSFGLALARGESVADLISPTKTVEGYFTAQAFAIILGQDLLKYPILSNIYSIVYQGLDKKNLLKALQDWHKA